MEAQLRDPLKPLGPSQHYRIAGFQGVYPPNIPTDASLSDSQRKFFQSGSERDGNLSKRKRPENCTNRHPFLFIVIKYSMLLLFSSFLLLNTFIIFLIIISHHLRELFPMFHQVIKKHLQISKNIFFFN